MHVYMIFKTILGTCFFTTSKVIRFCYNDLIINFVGIQLSEYIRPRV